QVPGRPAEVEPRRGLDADGALPEWHAVQVLLEDRRLVEVRLEAERPERLRELASPRARRRAEKPRGLHRQRRRARDDSPGGEVVAERAGDGAQVHAAVLEEAPVLRGDERLDQLRVDLGE